jgi:hypothetical protein
VPTLLARANVNTQTWFASREELAVMEDFPTLAELNAAFGRNTSAAWLAVQLADLSIYTGAKNLSKRQQDQLAEIITTEFYWLKVSELLLFFHRFKTGSYGTFFGAVDPMVVTRALREFILERNDIIAKINEEEKKIRDWKIYLKMVGKDGIGKMVLRQALPLINSELSRLLEGVCDFDVEVTIDDYNDVAFNIVRDGVVGNLNSGSGYEKTAASIALRAVLGKISTMPKPSFIVLDEVLGGVAEENYENIKKLYERILPDYSFVFHITHLQQLEEWSQQTVIVKKENNISKVLNVS